MNEKKSDWGSPTVIIALIGLFVSITTNIYQYSSSKGKFELAKEKWELEKEGLRIKLDEYEDQKKKRETHLREIETKIEELSNDIKYCEDEIARGQVGLHIYMKRRLDPSTSRSEKLDAEGKIAYANDLIENNRRKREKLISEKEKLENQRGSILMYQ